MRVSPQWTFFQKDNWATIFNKAQEHQKPRKSQI